jgi:predicted anti-sigma-YlaC factor YlaD
MECREAIDVMDEALEGRLEPIVRAGFDAHMAECGPCSNYFEHLRITRGVLRHLAGEETSGARFEELMRTYREKFRRRSN